MKDFATSSDNRVQAQLDRLAALSLPEGRLGLDTMRGLLERLGDPHRSLPPVFHVAGTNGKGSTCAFLRAMLEADGKAVHVATSPHLVRYNERIRIAGELVSDTQLAELLKEVLDLGEDLAPSFFEVTIAASFLAFARTPADACVIEVGMGGRFDATNTVDHPAACGIAALGIDHERFLLAPEEGVPDDPMRRIAFEKAGIVKRGCTVATLANAEGPTLEIERAAMAAGAPLAMRGREWSAQIGSGIEYEDRHGRLALPLPALPGAHQADNAALAVAMLRHQDFVTVTDEALGGGIIAARWPARLQLLADGPLTRGREIWLDGGHNPQAGEALGRHFRGRNLHLVIGMLANKDPRAITAPLEGNVASLSVLPVPGHEWHGASAFGAGATAFDSIDGALAALPDDGLPILIAGSLYLAGEVLRLNDEAPT